jgi:hypothetical protein
LSLATKKPASVAVGKEKERQLMKKEDDQIDADDEKISRWDMIYIIIRLY